MRVSLKNIVVFLMVSIILVGAGLLNAPAYAQQKPWWTVYAPGKWLFGWYPDHWKNQDFQPYYDYAKDPHNSQWDFKDGQPNTWTPAEWVSQRSSGLALINSWYHAGIIRDQYVATLDQRPILKVGPNFYHLSGEDKRRVAATVDYVYGATQKSPNMFYLLDYSTNDFIGYYTKDGLVLQ